MPIPESLHEILTLALFVAVILGGGLTAFVRLTDRDTPIDIGLLHGRLGVVGIISMMFILTEGDLTVFKLSIIGLFMLTGILGGVLYYVIRRKGELPVKIILVHAMFAVSGFLLLASQLIG